MLSQKHVNMAYNNDPGFFLIDNTTSTILEDPPLDLGIHLIQSYLNHAGRVIQTVFHKCLFKFTVSPYNKKHTLTGSSHVLTNWEIEEDFYKRYNAVPTFLGIIINY